MIVKKRSCWSIDTPAASGSCGSRSISDQKIEFISIACGNIKRQTGHICNCVMTSDVRLVMLSPVAAIVVQLVFVPSVVRKSPLLPVCEGRSAFNAALAVVWPVPPCAIVTAALSVRIVALAFGSVNVFSLVVGPVNFVKPFRG